MKLEEFKAAYERAKEDLDKKQLIDRTNDATRFINESIEPGDASLDIVREELAECIQAVSKMIRFGEEDDWWHLLEEVADVSMALDVIMEIFHIQKTEFNNAKMVKLDRMVKKIKENGGIK